MRATLCVVSGVLISIAAGPAFAQTDQERAAARDAANAGREAFDAGHYEQAIDSLSRAEQLVHAPTHLLFLARAQEKLGKLVAARETYLKITRESLAPDAPKAFVDAQTAARQERDGLAARVPSVTITVQGAAAAGARVQMDGTALPSAMIGIPLPVDPGQHVLTASAAAAESTRVTVALSEGGTEHVTLTLNGLGATPTTDTSAVAATPTPDARTADGPSKKSSGLRVASYASFGVGALGVGIGTTMLLKSGSTRGSANQLFNACSAAGPNGRCSDPTEQTAIMAKDSDADGQRDLGAGSLVAGGIAAAAGVTFLLLDARRNSHTPAQAAERRIVPVLGARSLAVLGTF